MKRVFITLLIPILAISLSATAAIKFESKEVSFGEIESGKVVDLVFNFENTGDELLVIKNIAASCGCTATKLEKKEYKPGEKGTLPVKFYSQGYNGKVIKSITVSTNDPNNVYTRLKISGKVNMTNFASIEVTNDRLDFQEIQMGDQYTQAFKLKNTGTINLRIIEVTHSPDFYPVFPKKELGPDEEIEVKVVLTPMQAGRFAQFLKIRSNSYRQRMVIVKISAEVKE